MPKAQAQRPSLEIFILAGGLSSRMGRDKTRLRLGRKTLLTHVRDAAQILPHRVRLIRRDAVPRCGPLGGILTALKRTRAKTILLLACDMPLVSPTLLKKMLRSFRVGSPALFANENQRAGFPCLLRRDISLPIVEQQIARAEFSLQSLAKKLRAKTFRPPPSLAHQLTNLNTPEELRALLSHQKFSIAKPADKSKVPPATSANRPAE